MRVAGIIVSALVCLLGCGRFGPARAEFPGDVSDPDLYAAIAELELGEEVIDPDVVCRATRLRAPSARRASCRAPDWLALERPELRDLRRERLSWHLSRPARYERMIAQLESALTRSEPHTRARKKLLGWLVTAHHRLREASGREHPCGLHYLEVAVQDAGHTSSLRYTYALELERSGERERALGTYRVILAEDRATPAFAAAHAALGDHAFRQSFCDRTALGTAHDHYLVAAHGRAPRGVPISGYARLRLAQVELELGALGPALRQLENAEADGIPPPASASGGERWRRLRELLESTVRSLAKRALADGTLRLLLAFEPPGASLCHELQELSRRHRGSPRAADLAMALAGPCSWTSHHERLRTGEP